MYSDTCCPDEINLVNLTKLCLELARDAYLCDNKQLSMKLKINTLLLLLLTSTGAWSQSLQVKGRVMDGDNNSPLPDVVVTAANNESRSDKDGYFQLVIAQPAQMSLTVTFYKAGFSLLEKTAFPEGMRELDLGMVTMVHS
ncbi:MAG: CarboxypepD reg-like domain, partial [Bacteroidota bacterium]